VAEADRDRLQPARAGILIRMRPEPPDLPPEPATTRDADLSNLRAHGKQVDEHVIAGVRLAGSGLSAAQIRDVELRGCDLANVDLRGARLRRVRVVESRLTGVRMSGADLAELEVAGCRADMAAFDEAQLERVRFEDCVLQGSDWQGAKLRLVAFERCDLTGADLSDVRFESVQMHDCKLDGIRGATALRGVTMRWEDVLASASVFAAACGVRIGDPSDRT
jgi:uncharacterized protein YjbI with pentapeptide repeats